MEDKDKENANWRSSRNVSLNEWSSDEEISFGPHGPISDYPIHLSTPNYLGDRDEVAVHTPAHSPTRKPGSELDIDIAKLSRTPKSLIRRVLQPSQYWEENVSKCDSTTEQFFSFSDDLILNKDEADSMNSSYVVIDPIINNNSVFFDIEDIDSDVEVLGSSSLEPNNNIVSDDKDMNVSVYLKQAIHCDDGIEVISEQQIDFAEKVSNWQPIQDGIVIDILAEIPAGVKDPQTVEVVKIAGSKPTGLFDNSEEVETAQASEVISDLPIHDTLDNQSLLSPFAKPFQTCLLTGQSPDTLDLKVSEKVMMISPTDLSMINVKLRDEISPYEGRISAVPAVKSEINFLGQQLTDLLKYSSTHEMMSEESDILNYDLSFEDLTRQHLTFDPSPNKNLNYSPSPTKTAPEEIISSTVGDEIYLPVDENALSAGEMDLPVENISFKDVNSFISNVLKEFPELEISAPKDLSEVTYSQNSVLDALVSINNDIEDIDLEIQDASVSLSSNSFTELTKSISDMLLLVDGKADDGVENTLEKPDDHVLVPDEVFPEVMDMLVPDLVTASTSQILEDVRDSSETIEMRTVTNITTPEVSVANPDVINATSDVSITTQDLSVIIPDIYGVTKDVNTADVIDTTQDVSITTPDDYSTSSGISVSISDDSVTAPDVCGITKDIISVTTPYVSNTKSDVSIITVEISDDHVLVPDEVFPDLMDILIPDLVTTSQILEDVRDSSETIEIETVTNITNQDVSITTPNVSITTQDVSTTITEVSAIIPDVSVTSQDASITIPDVTVTTPHVGVTIEKSDHHVLVPDEVFPDLMDILVPDLTTASTSKLLEDVRDSSEKEDIGTGINFITQDVSIANPNVSVTTSEHNSELTPDKTSDFTFPFYSDILMPEINNVVLIPELAVRETVPDVSPDIIDFCQTAERPEDTQQFNSICEDMTQYSTDITQNTDLERIADVTDVTSDSYTSTSSHEELISDDELANFSQSLLDIEIQVFSETPEILFPNDLDIQFTGFEIFDKTSDIAFPFNSGILMPEVKNNVLIPELEVRETVPGISSVIPPMSLLDYSLTTEALVPLNPTLSNIHPDTYSSDMPLLDLSSPGSGVVLHADNSVKAIGHNEKIIEDNDKVLSNSLVPVPSIELESQIMDLITPDRADQTSHILPDCTDEPVILDVTRPDIEQSTELEQDPGGSEIKALHSNKGNGTVTKERDHIPDPVNQKKPASLSLSSIPEDCPVTRYSETDTDIMTPQNKPLIKRLSGTPGLLSPSILSSIDEDALFSSCVTPTAFFADVETDKMMLKQSTLTPVHRFKNASKIAKNISTTSSNELPQHLTVKRHSSPAKLSTPNLSKPAQESPVKVKYKLRPSAVMVPERRVVKSSAPSLSLLREARLQSPVQTTPTKVCQNLSAPKLPWFPPSPNPNFSTTSPLKPHRLQTLRAVTKPCTPPRILNPRLPEKVPQTPPRVMKVKSAETIAQTSPRSRNINTPNKSVPRTNPTLPRSHFKKIGTPKSTPVQKCDPTITPKVTDPLIQSESAQKSGLSKPRSLVKPTSISTSKPPNGISKLSGLSKSTGIGRAIFRVNPASGLEKASRLPKTRSAELPKKLRSPEGSDENCCPGSGVKAGPRSAKKTLGSLENISSTPSREKNIKSSKSESSVEVKNISKLAPPRTKLPSRLPQKASSTLR